MGCGNKSVTKNQGDGDMKLEDMSVEELRAVMDRIAYSEGTAREIFEILASL